MLAGVFVWSPANTNALKMLEPGAVTLTVHMTHAPGVGVGQPTGKPVSGVGKGKSMLGVKTCWNAGSVWLGRPSVPGQ